MKHFKDVAGEVWGFEDDGSQDRLIAATMVSIEGEDLERIRNPPMSDTEALALQAAEGRLESVDYLNKTDWYFVREMETGVAVPESIRTLRTEARDRVQSIDQVNSSF